jgi:hypothetical protein
MVDGKGELFTASLSASAAFYISSYQARVCEQVEMVESLTSRLGTESPGRLVSVLAVVSVESVCGDG